MRFCCTVSHGKTEPACEIRIPRELGLVSGAPSMLTEPRSGLSKPATMFISVDLPQPDGPTIATMSPSPTSKLMPSSTCKVPCSVVKLLPMPSTRILVGALLVGIAPPDDFQALEQAHQPVEHQADQADDDHAGDDEVVAVAGVARVDDQVTEPGMQRDHLGGDDDEP